jgi:hypothetical protein
VQFHPVNSGTVPYANEQNSSPWSSADLTGESINCRIFCGLCFEIGSLRKKYFKLQVFWKVGNTFDSFQCE